MSVFSNSGCVCIIIPILQYSLSSASTTVFWYPTDLNLFHPASPFVYGLGWELSGKTYRLYIALVEPIFRLLISSFSLPARQTEVWVCVLLGNILLSVLFIYWWMFIFIISGDTWLIFIAVWYSALKIASYEVLDFGNFVKWVLK